MNNNKLELVEIPEEIAGDALTALLRNGAKALISQAVEEELAAILMSYQHGKACRWTTSCCPQWLFT